MEGDERRLWSEIIDVTKIDAAELAEISNEALCRAIDRVCQETAEESTAYLRFDAAI